MQPDIRETTGEAQLQLGGKMDTILLGGRKGHRDLCRVRKIEFISKPFDMNFLGTVLMDSGVDALEWETVISNTQRSIV